MKNLTPLAVAVPALGIAALLFSAQPASAISAELAKQCRKLSLEAHPPARVGTKKGSAALERQFYQACLANGGSPPNEARGSGASQAQPPASTPAMDNQKK